MSKAVVLPATCMASVVTALGVPVQPVTILSQGKGQSSGFLLLFGDESFYIASSALDIKTTIEKLMDVIQNASDALTQASTGLSSAGAALDGIVPGSGTSTTAAGTAITPLVTALNAVKTELNTLKAGLI